MSTRNKAKEKRKKEEQKQEIKRQKKFNKVNNMSKTNGINVKRKAVAFTYSDNEEEQRGIPIIPILLVFIIIALFAYLFFMTDTFKSKRQIFEKYLFMAYEELDSEENVNLSRVLSKLDENKFTITGNGSFDCSSNSMSPEEQKLQQALNGSKIESKGYGDLSKKKFKNTYTLKTKDNEIASITIGRGEYINKDLQVSDLFAITSPEVVNAYIGVENGKFNKLASDLEDKNYYLVPSGLNYRLSSYLKLLSLKENEKENIKKTYIDYFNKAFQNSQFSKINSVDVSISGTVYVAKQYSLNLNKTQANSFITGLFDTLKTDSLTLNCIAQKAKLLGYEEISEISKLSEKLDEISIELSRNPIKYGISIDEYVCDGKLIQLNITAENKAAIIIQPKLENNTKSMHINFRNLDLLQNTVNMINTTPSDDSQGEVLDILNPTQETQISTNGLFSELDLEISSMQTDSQARFIINTKVNNDKSVNMLIVLNGKSSDDKLNVNTELTIKDKNNTKYGISCNEEIKFDSSLNEESGILFDNTNTANLSQANKEYVMGLKNAVNKQIDNVKKQCVERMIQILKEE